MSTQFSFMQIFLIIGNFSVFSSDFSHGLWKAADYVVLTEILIVICNFSLLFITLTFVFTTQKGEVKYGT
jgi:hypothetical protein